MYACLQGTLQCSCRYRNYGDLFEWGYVLDVMLNDIRQPCFRESKMQELLLIQSENKNWSNETLSM